ncbi:adhesion G protein-coupled receptor A2 isoform X2 [Hemicordylus capensis]|uniref:adhesion G protein-coupled receptor A2 isoform X2 n=1 Tax=Hemicordylus capensis TaxID=884348 RepID=UPI002302AAE0|nr:adhesion G protein-coupled receptor A2 isoform X2 [Hemicordylus capensis]
MGSGRCCREPLLSRMLWAAALFLQAALLCAGGARSCPAQLRGCKCVAERAKGLPMPSAARKRVSCSGEELMEPPAPRLLPNGTGTLVLSNNKIATLKNGSFFGLHALQKLDLRNNLISTIQPGAFLGLSDLKRLDLSNNRIGCLGSGIFQGLGSLTRLNVSGNIFSGLQLGIFDELPSLKNLDFATEYLTCDCNMRWVLSWSKNRSVQISDKTVCVYPSTLHGKPLRNTKENQMHCEGVPELHTHQLIPSLRQVVFQGDRLPFQCTATYLDNSTHILWYHNRALVQGDELSGIIVEESLVHDCTFITSELILSNIHVSASGEWECTITTAQGNVSKKVEIVVLETSASYCPAERVTNNRGDFRWPRTLAGITAYQSCLQYPFTSGNGGAGLEKQACRRCDRTGRWEEGDYSHCLYTNDITRVLYTFVLMPINASNALTLAHQLRVYTAEAANFSDMMDVIYVSQMIEKFTGYVDQIKQNSRNIAFEAYLIKPESYMGLSCTAFQKHEAGLSSRPPRQERYAESFLDQQLKFRCTAGRPNISLASFHVKNSIALASIQLPPGLFTPPASPHPLPLKCKLQFLVFRNGKLFRSTGNSSHLADDGKRRSVATPVIYAGTHDCGISNLTEPVAISLRHLGKGTDRTAAYWDFDVLDGYGGWRAEGCQLVALEPNVTTVICQHLSNVAVLMELSNFLGESSSPAEVLYSVIYTCTALLLLSLFATIISYIVHHSAIHISRKCWHLLLNLCFHIAMTSSVFAGSITLTNYLVICQAVGIILHYSSLSTLLWMVVMARVIYKEATWKAPQQPEGEASQPPPRPMLRFYLIAGGIPLIICGITAAVNIHNYGDHDSYCWLACRPSIGAFYVPAAFIVLLTWIYFLCAGISLQRQAKNAKAAPEPLEAPQRLGGGGGGGSSNFLTDSGSISVTLHSSPHGVEADGVYSLGVQFWALVITHFLSVTLWAFGALAVSQHWSLLKVLFSCLYGVTALLLGLFVFAHHCVRRGDVRSSWFACCPSYRHALPMQAYGQPGTRAEDGSQVFIGGSPEAAPSAKSSPSPSSTNSAPSPCKLTNLQVALGQAEGHPLPPAGSEEAEPSGGKNAHPARYANNLHGRSRHHKSRTKQYREGKHQQRLKAARGPSSEHPTSESGSLHNSHSESYQSSRNSPLNNQRQAALPSLESPLTQSDLSDGGGSSRHHHHQGADFGSAQRRSASRDNLKHQANATAAAATLEKESKRRSFPLNAANQNGALKGSKYDMNLSGADSAASMKTGLWKSETTV